MTKEEIKAMVAAFEAKRVALPCPFKSDAGCTGCRFNVPAVMKKVVDQRITVVGGKAPEDFVLTYKCEIDLISAEVSAIHTQLDNFLKSLQVVQ